MSVTKPDLGGGISHPARYSKHVLEALVKETEGFVNIIDPFAGTGLIHRLQDHGHETVGVEIEPEWANMHHDTLVGDATDLQFVGDTFDAVVTSPTFGNRMADHHNARDGSVRRTYTHDLGRTLHPNNSGWMQWGEAYRDLHKLAWAEAYRVVKPGGIMILNSKNHIRAGKEVDVTSWHIGALCKTGFEFVHSYSIHAQGMKAGVHREKRTAHELIIRFQKPL